MTIGPMVLQTSLAFLTDVRSHVDALECYNWWNASWGLSKWWVGSTGKDMIG